MRLIEEFGYFLMRCFARAALPCVELADSIWMRTFARILRELPDEWLQTKRGHRFHAWLCGWNGHANVFWFNPCGNEPDMDCTRCGEDLG